MQDKVTQTKEELLQHLEEQIEFLKSSALAFDKGQEIEAKRMATIIRILVHDTSVSKSLLGQLGMKNKKFLITCQLWQGGKMAQRGLIFRFLDGIPKYYAMLDDVPESKKTDFETWWNEKIFLAKDDISFSRKDIILTVSNQDGGAHVDPEIESSYLKLSRNNLLGDLAGDGKTWKPCTNPERASIRQIAHEILKTLIDNYSQYPPKKEGLIFGNIARIKVERNDPCPCKSGKKFKKCHGKPN